MPKSRKYPAQFLDNLKNDQYTAREDGLEIHYKRIPDTREDGVLDSRVYRSLHIPMMLAKHVPRRKNTDPVKTILGMRNMFNRVKSRPITRTDTRIEKLSFEHDNVRIPIRIIIPAKPGPAKLPVLYFMHGGGFFAGSSGVVQEACKLFAESYPCIAVSVDYRLAPEHPYPAGHTDCFAGLQWIYRNIETYGGDRERIFAAGDSAGGNLVLYCVQKDMENKTNMIKAQALYYPAVNMSGREDAYFKAGRQNYTVKRKYEHIVFGMLDMMGAAGIERLLGTGDLENPCLSPYWAGLAGMPPAIMLYGEYDFLFAECKAFGRKLNAAQVPVKTVIYKGLIHAFLDNTGVLAQAEDSVMEVIDFMRKWVG